MTKIPVELADIRPDRIQPVQSRYLKSKVLYYGEKRKITFTTYKRQTFVPTEQDRVMLISKAYEFRPDLISFDVYGMVHVWWKIMEINQIYDIFDFVAGRTIKMPINIFE